mmetsp:Transcript_8369/g.30886  ORF Transcript_8369/g.30886 Transcript_8369/m.30886 type:complete len:511 (-) Transcript_8369:322-1854(-)
MSQILHRSLAVLVALAFSCLCVSVVQCSSLPEFRTPSTHMWKDAHSEYSSAPLVTIKPNASAITLKRRRPCSVIAMDHETGGNIDSVYRCEYDEDEQVYSPAMLEGHGWIGKPDLANAEQRLKKHIYAYVCVFNTIRHLRSLFALGLSLYSSKTDADIVAMVAESIFLSIEREAFEARLRMAGFTHVLPYAQEVPLPRLQVLRLVQYERIVLLDAGTIVSEGHNIDHLFHLDAESAAVGVSPTRHGRCQDLPRDPLVRRFVDSSLLLHAKVNFTSCDFCEGFKVRDYCMVLLKLNSKRKMVKVNPRLLVLTPSREAFKSAVAVATMYPHFAMTCNTEESGKPDILAAHGCDDSWIWSLWLSGRDHVQLLPTRYAQPFGSGFRDAQPKDARCKERVSVSHVFGLDYKAPWNLLKPANADLTVNPIKPRERIKFEMAQVRLWSRTDSYCSSFVTFYKHYLDRWSTRKDLSTGHSSKVRVLDSDGSLLKLNGDADDVDDTPLTGTFAVEEEDS